MEQLKGALAETPIRDEVIERLTSELAELQADSFRDRVRAIAQTRRTLTPEQLERIRRIMEAGRR